ncbi:MAG: NAD(P)/FAD-dependent oxidoreductase [Nitriliruptorales bacterium]|nr:NAD(P)/FAD-dependent oxidoreductase [Nitriliruptorales bacterium]
MNGDETGPGDRDAVVVGAGPNGLTAAAVLADAGLDVAVLEASDTPGGGVKTEELTIGGLAHDVCSAVHPFGAASPVFRDLALEELGLRWRHPDVAVAHPLDDGSAACVLRDLDETAAALGRDGDVWRSLFSPLVEGWDDLADEILRPVIHVPKHPLKLARFGLQGLLPASVVGRRFQTERGRALWAGIAAHSILPFDKPFTSAFALMMGAAGHAAGWPVAEGGSGAITDALVQFLDERGVEIRTGTRVMGLDELPRTRAALFDVTPRQLLAICGDALPPITRRRYAKWRYGPAAFKVDLAVEGGVPWTAESARRAGTVHLGGTLEEIAEAEQAVADGRVPDRPFVLLAQQYVADPSRSVGDVHPVWAYCHVPNGWAGDATEQILGQIERFAPGFRDRIVERTVLTPDWFEGHTPNSVGGDISGGSHDGLQLLGRPVLSPDPYRTGLPGVWLCSSSTPPGGGVHGMCGANAAASVLRALG